MGRFRRSPFRCRGCHNRFYVYFPLEKEEEEEDLAAATADGEVSPTDADAHNSDLAKPAEP
ncbi:MAG TPA: hypothetical protein VHW09_24235 [Bryobacteraceae bacterium]|jgi:hypothetical protein|nr:hypothetical protein [Bryobacteraceae bacterium]